MIGLILKALLEALTRGIWLGSGFSQYFPHIIQVPPAATMIMIINKMKRKPLRRIGKRCATLSNSILSDLISP